LWPASGLIERLATDGLPPGLPPAAIAAGLSTAQELGGRGKKLVELFSNAQPKPAAVATTADRPGDLAAWAALTQKSGDPLKGEALYFSAAMACVQCHAIGGAGGLLGPDMSTLGASAPLDYVIESVLQPAAKVKEGYHSVTFRLKDGGLVTGIPAGESERDIRVRLPGIEQVVLKDAIAGRDTVAGSLMPAGLVDPLPVEDQANLFAFLGALGKPGPFDASDAKVARVWRISGDLPEGVAPDLSKMPPVYSLVDGRVLPRAWRTALGAVAGEGPVYAMAQVEVPAAGLLTLSVEGQERPWLDGIRFDPQETGRKVEAGRHTIAVSVNRNSLPKTLRLRVDAGRFVTP
jgi:putative heme-binding domain-containing protein